MKKPVFVLLLIVASIYLLFNQFKEADNINISKDIDIANNQINNDCIFDIQESDLEVKTLQTKDFPPDVFKCIKTSTSFPFIHLIGVRNDGTILGYIKSSNYNEEDVKAMRDFKYMNNVGQIVNTTAEDIKSVECYEHLFTFNNKLDIVQHDSLNGQVPIYTGSVFDEIGDTFSNYFLSDYMCLLAGSTNCSTPNIIKKSSGLDPQFVGDNTSYVTAISSNGNYIILSQKSVNGDYYNDYILDKSKNNYSILSTVGTHIKFEDISNNGDIVAFDRLNCEYLLCNIYGNCVAITKYPVNMSCAWQPMQMKISSNGKFAYVQNIKNQCVMNVTKHNGKIINSSCIDSLIGYQIVSDVSSLNRGFVTDDGLLLVEKNNSLFIYDFESDKLYNLNYLLFLIKLRYPHFKCNLLTAHDSTDNNNNNWFLSKNGKYLLLRVSDNTMLKMHFIDGLRKYLLMHFDQDMHTFNS